jgi:predicted RNase H-like HicB family nuclease
MPDSQKYRCYKISVCPTSRVDLDEGRAAFTASATITQHDTFLEGFGFVTEFSTGMATFGDTSEAAVTNVKSAVDEHYENQARQIIPLAVLPRDTEETSNG